MEALKKGLQEGTLKHLEILRNQSIALNEVQKSIHGNQAELERLRLQCLKLEKKKNQLLQQLKRTPGKTVEEEIRKAVADLDPDSKDLSLNGDIALSMEDKSLISKEVESQTQYALDMAYRLAGATFFQTDTHRFGVRLETFAEGTYQEPSYIIIDYVPTLKAFRVFRHSLPAFLNLDEIERKHLNTNIRAFVSAVSSTLNAYVSRREEIKKLGQLSQVSGVRTSLSHDRVEFFITESAQRYRCRLLWRNFDWYLPTRASIKPENDSRSRLPLHVSKRAKILEHTFLRERLLSVFSN